MNELSYRHGTGLAHEVRQGKIWYRAFGVDGELMAEGWLMDEDEPAWKSINIALVADLSDHDYRFYRWA